MVQSIQGLLALCNIDGSVKSRVFCEKNNKHTGMLFRVVVFILDRKQDAIPWGPAKDYKYLGKGREPSQILSRKCSF